jgi:hypothetical protein
LIETFTTDTCGFPVYRKQERYNPNSRDRENRELGVK